MSTSTTTIIRAVILALIGGLGCEQERAKPQPPRPAETPDTTEPPAPSNPGAAVSPIELTWSLSKAPDKKSLVLEYEIVNPGDQPIFIVDDHAKTTTAGLAVAADEVAILLGDDPGTARLVAGHVPLAPGQASEVVPIAPAHELPAKGRREGTKTIPLPLKGWIAIESRWVDLSSATRATFEVTWLRPPPKDRESWAWETQKSATGQVIRTPFIGYVNTMGGQARTDPIAIP